MSGVIRHSIPFGEVFIEEKNSTWNTPYKFNGKEQDEETGLYYFGARYYDPRVSLWLGVDPMADKYPNYSPYVYCLNNPLKFIDLDGRKPTPEAAALMAKNVYGGQDAKDTKGPLKALGWTVSNFKTKIEKNSPWYADGLQSQLYQKTTDGITEYAYVFAGTNSPEDVAQDAAQPLGMSTQYEHAVDNTKTLVNELGGKELTLVGHSLGGGEAAASSMATGKEAITFNPASVSGLTKLFLGLGSADKVTNYITIGKPLFKGSSLTAGGDPLNNVQNNVGASAPGVIIYDPTNSYAPSHSVDAFQNKKLPR